MQLNRQKLTLVTESITAELRERKRAPSIEQRVERVRVKISSREFELRTYAESRKLRELSGVYKAKEQPQSRSRKSDKE
ncbi:hypothetical protein HYFRA_00006625 [Hymenoscyphus fraxineus]|uniref:Uncharacterized protein n=1 Tax=Hymenoscyphus fraxineus TaxID=746836 RepID=A0A9N9PS28_9HELO|nr:hypothetical protein HYFRA_00006625 [Hymenoscyphus fraxineus]